MIGLATYRTESRRGVAPAFAPVAERPKGELVWIQAGEPGGGRAKYDLARELLRARDDMSILMTTELSENLPEADRLIIDRIPDEHPDYTEAFLAHWAPDTALWLWGGLRPNLILSTWKAGAPMYIVDAGQDGFDRARDGWLPEVPRNLLAHFDGWFARSEAAKSRLVQLGCPDALVAQVPPLQPLGETLPFAETELDEMRAELSGRPVWFARSISASEVAYVLEAHKNAMRSAPRLLLIIEPTPGVDISWMTDRFAEAELRHATWSEGETPNESVQIMLADETGDAGLWYSLASVSFLGQSLDPDGKGCNPYEAAAHGSAVLYGPHVDEHLRSYSRLAAAGAARLISDAQSLSTAIARLTSPDQAATMAMAAWDVVTAGATATDKIATLVCNVLDKRAGHSE